MREMELYINRLLAESTPECPLWNIESVRQGKKPSWNYIDGCMMTALWRFYITSGDKRFFDFVKNYIDYFVGADGSIKTYDMQKFNLDDINEGRVLFDLYGATGDERYHTAIEALALQLKNQPRTSTGNFWHKKIYPDQIWLDGIYMAQVFLCRYQTAFGGADYSDMLSQIKNVRKLMFDENKKLYYHGIDCSQKAFWANEKGLSHSFWLRSIGWFLVALADICEYCRDKKVVKQIGKILAEAVEGVAQYIDAQSGMLFQVVDKIGEEGNYPETSGSCMVAYAMLKGARLGVLPQKYAQTGREIFDGVCKKYLKVSSDGQLNLGGICLVAGLGPENNRRRDGSYAYYISEPVVQNDAKGVAPLIMCYSEI